MRECAPPRREHPTGMVQRINVTRLGRTLLESAPLELRATVRSGACKDLDAAVKRVTVKPRTIKQYDVDSAVSIVKELTDVDALIQVGRSDTRSGVQHALSNHHIKVEMAGRHSQSGGKRKTAAMLEGTVEEVIQKLREADNKTDWNQVLDWARALTGTEKVLAYRSLIRAHSSVRSILLADVQRQSVPGLPISEILAGPDGKADTWHQKRIVSEIVQAWTGDIDSALAELIVKYETQTHSRHTATREAAVLLSESGQRAHNMLALASGQLTTEEAVKMFDKADRRVRSNLLDEAPTLEIAEAYALRTGNDGNTSLGYNGPSRILNKWGALSTQARLNILALAGGREILEWASGQYSAVPRPGEAKTVAQQILADDNKNCSVTELVNAFNRDANLSIESVAEMWEVLYTQGKNISKQLLIQSSGGKLTEDVVGKLAKSFGDDTSAWEMLATVLPEWNGTIPELIDTVHLVAT